jgi:hypothetical protein
VLNDQGKKAAANDVADRVNRDEQVLALDLMFTGEAWKVYEPHQYAEGLAGEGERPLGMQAAQLIAVAHWCQKTGGVQKVRIEVRGIRNQVAATLAAALEPTLFSEVVVREGMPSLGYLLDAPVKYEEAPELFCLDLYKEFDLDRIAAFAAPVKVTVEKFVQPVAKK